MSITKKKKVYKLMTLLPKPGKHITRKESYRPLFLINLDVKFLKKFLPNQIQQYIKKIIVHHDQVTFTPECKVALTFKNRLLNVLDYNNKL